MSATSTPPKWEDMPELMDRKDLMEMLRVSENTVYTLAREGFLKDIVVHVGRQMRVPRSALRKLLEGEANNG